MRRDRSTHKYSTVVDDAGVNYREISEIMTELGYPMRHSSVRNYVINVIRKFVCAFADEYGIRLSDDRVNEISKDPDFQSTIIDILQSIEFDRRKRSTNLRLTE